MAKTQTHIMSPTQGIVVSFGMLHARHDQLRAEIRSGKLNRQDVRELVRMEQVTIATVALQHDAIRMGGKINSDVAYTIDHAEPKQIG